MARAHPTERRPRAADAVSPAARLYQLGVGLGGLSLWALAWLATGAHLPTSVIWLAVPVAVLVSRWPLVLDQANGGVVVSLDAAILLFLAFTTPLGDALALWGAVVVSTHLTTSKALDTRIFNAGESGLAGVASLVLVPLLEGPVARETIGLGLLRTPHPFALGLPNDPALARFLRPGHPGELLVVAAVALVYFLLDYLLSATGLVLLGRLGFRQALFHANAPFALASVVGAGALGYLAAVVERSEPVAVVLMLLPFAAVLLASRALGEAHLARVRAESLAEATAAAQRSETAEEIEELVTTAAARALRTPSVVIRAEPPRPGELGCPLAAGAPTRFLVGGPRPTKAPFDSSDARSLDAFSAVAAEALERLRLLAELRRRALSDPLTDLPNRAALAKRLSIGKEEEARALVFLDLDGFKAVNDTLGHLLGDQLLRVVARRLVRTAREGDLVARLGGDEFALYLPATGVEGARAAAERIVEALRTPIQLEGHELQVGASVGIAVSVGGGDPASDDEQLLRHADIAMYEAKARSDTRCVLFQPEMLERREARAALADDLGSALDAGELVVLYEPVVELATGELAELDADVRWEHPRLGALGASVVAEAARSGGRSDALTDFLVERVLTDGARLAATFDRVVAVAIPAGPDRLGPVRLAELATGRSRGIMPTLSVSAADVTRPDALAWLAAVQAARVRIVLDGADTGRSLGQLARLPLDGLKVSGELVRNLASGNPRPDRAVLAACVSFAEALAVPVAARGVASAECVHQLRAFGCHLGQGPYFLPPSPMADVIRWLAGSFVRVDRPAASPTRSGPKEQTTPA